MLGIVLLLAGLAASWAQDVAAPWLNEGEADLGGEVAFTSGGGRYRVISSGPERPALEQIGCTITSADERQQRVLGGEDVNPTERLGVSRVLGFDAPAGRTTVTCANRIVRSSTGRGRFQVVPADGPVSIAVIVLFVVGGVLVGVSLLLIVRARA